MRLVANRQRRHGERIQRLLLLREPRLPRRPGAPARHRSVVPRHPPRLHQVHRLPVRPRVLQHHAPRPGVDGHHLPARAPPLLAPRLLLLEGVVVNVPVQVVLAKLRRAEHDALRLQAQFGAGDGRVDVRQVLTEPRARREGVAAELEGRAERLQVDEPLRVHRLPVLQRLEGEHLPVHHPVLEVVVADPPVLVGRASGVERDVGAHAQPDSEVHELQHLNLVHGHVVPAAP
ncbi:cell division protein ZapA [Babesia caballi]|uniref:Cell division protein ZapA n=1 Tax=Babesia caballi TaxID=5871 RepID=A0AAV4LYE3_BABCB|nr:cell division protein ZapA [Babesia caballi]